MSGRKICCDCNSRYGILPTFSKDKRTTCDKCAERRSKDESESRIEKERAKIAKERVYNNSKIANEKAEHKLMIAKQKAEIAKEMFKSKAEAKRLENEAKRIDTELKIQEEKTKQTKIQDKGEFKRKDTELRIQNEKQNRPKLKTMERLNVLIPS